MSVHPFHTDLPKLQSVLNNVLLDIISWQIHWHIIGEFAVNFPINPQQPLIKTEVTRSCHKFCDNWLLTFFETNVSLSHLMYLTSMQTFKTAFFPAVIHRPGLLTCLQASLSQHMKLERERESFPHCRLTLGNFSLGDLRRQNECKHPSLNTPH